MSFLEKYVRRLKKMKTVNLWDAKNYNPQKQRPWTKKRNAAILSVFPRRRLTADPEAREQYFRQQVLLSTHWRTEDDALGILEYTFD